MSTMLVEIYDALKEAGASEEKARAAATSLTGRDQHWSEVEQRIQRLEQRLDLVEQALEALTARIAALEQKVIAVTQDVAVIKAELVRSLSM